MHQDNARKSKSTPKLKLVTRAPSNTDAPDEFDHLNFRAGGTPEDMQPGDYLVECIDYEPWKPRGKVTAVVLRFITIDGAWRDVELRQWLPIYPGKSINPGTKTWDHWALALGTKPNRREQFHPRVFLGKRFVAEVGYSSKNEQGIIDPKNTVRPKYEGDRLRVHELKSLAP
jgi:hypothetical protein